MIMSMNNLTRTYRSCGYKMCLKTKRLLIAHAILFTSMAAIITDASVVTSIDLTTHYTPLSKTTSSDATVRNAKVKSMKSSSSSLSSLSTMPSRIINNLSDNQQQPHNLMAISAKSYISQSNSTLQPILLKRMDIKLKKPLKDLLLNGSKEVQRNSKLEIDAPDHIPDSSGHIPYRIGRPHSPPPQSPYIQSEYDTTGDSPPTSKGPTAYHGSPYEAEKWHAEYWDRDYEKQFHYNSTKVHHIEAECQDDYMKIRIGFNGSFSGLVYSAGYAYDPDCIYINGTGRDYYEFFIQLNRCGTLGKNSLHDDNIKNPTNFMWNTVTVQYNPLIEEEYDEHFKVTCEYGYDFWKTVTFPFLDVEVATGNPVVFTLSPPECYMEIQNGYGIGGPRVVGPVRVGDPLTLIIYMRSKYDGFDIVVNDCNAHNGANKRIQLIDQYGCPVDDKLISRFRGSWSETGIFETQVYAYMKTFRFTGSPALYIECDVRMCHGRCPSQPCHWRNLKAVTKREIGFNTTTSPDPDTEPNLDMTERPNTPLSENVNLFQSLRVLKDGETDESFYVDRQQQNMAHTGNQTCLKTITFSAITVTFSMLLCILCACLIITCTHLRSRKRDASIYDYYITHKGQID